MTERPWMQRYADDVAPELPAISYDNLPAMIREAATEYGPQIAFTQCMPNGMNGSLTYTQVDELSDHFAAYLREVIGLGPGDRVAVQMPNCLTYPVVAFGVFKAGACSSTRTRCTRPPRWFTSSRMREPKRSSSSTCSPTGFPMCSRGRASRRS